MLLCISYTSLSFFSRASEERIAALSVALNTHTHVHTLTKHQQRERTWRKHILGSVLWLITTVMLSKFLSKTREKVWEMSAANILMLKGMGPKKPTVFLIIYKTSRKYER